MPAPDTVNLIAERQPSGPFFESVAVEKLDDNLYRLLRSPGLVPGLATGDEFLLDDQQPFGYRLIRRAGNVCVQLFLKENVADCRDQLVPLARTLGGSLDGEVSLPTSSGLVFTIPMTAGFPAIESLMRRATELSPGCEWLYGNVYDPVDGQTPLNWWAKK